MQPLSFVAVLLALALPLALVVPASGELSFFTAPSKFNTLRSTAIDLPDGSFTIEFWYRSVWRGGAEFILNICDSSFSDNLVLFGITTSNRCYFSSYLVGSYVAPCPRNDKWTHTAIVFNASSTYISLFINHELNTQILTGTSDYPDVDYFTLGNDADSGCVVSDTSQAFTGKLAEFRIWDYALTPAERLAVAAGPVSTASPGLATYFRFDPSDVSGSTYNQVPGMPALPLTGSSNLPEPLPPSVPFVLFPDDAVYCAAYGATPFPTVAIPALAPASITDAVATDIDGDGLVDIAYVQYDSAPSAGDATVAFALSNGNFSFAHPVVVSSMPNAQRILAGDITGAGRPSILVYDAGFDLLRVFLPAASPAPVAYTLAPYFGTGAATSFTISSAERGFHVVADVTGDGNPDLLVVASSGLSISLVSFTPTTASASTIHSVGSGPLSLPLSLPALPDYNGDTFGDLWYIHDATPLPKLYVALRTAPGVYNTGGAILLAGDYSDLTVLSPTRVAISNDYESTTLWEVPGDSTATPILELLIAPWMGKQYLASGVDIDNNGLDDIVVVRDDASPYFSVSYQTAPDVYTQLAPVASISVAKSTRLVAGDWNGDGLFDLLTYASASGGTPAVGTATFWSSGTGLAFLAPVPGVAPAPVACSPSALAIFPVDINHDGVVDAVTLCHDTGSFRGPTATVVVGPVVAGSVVDADSNGMLDLVALLASGDVLFVPEPMSAGLDAASHLVLATATAGATDMVATDVDGDGHVDIVLVTPTNLVLLVNTPVAATPVLAPPRPLLAAPTAPALVVASDTALLFVAPASPNDVSFLLLPTPGTSPATPHTLSLVAPVITVSVDSNGALALLTSGAIVSFVPEPVPVAGVVTTLPPALTPPPGLGTTTLTSRYSAIFPDTASLVVLAPAASHPVVVVAAHPSSGGYVVRSAPVLSTDGAPGVLALGDVSSDGLVDLMWWTSGTTMLSVFAASGGTSAIDATYPSELLPECGGVRGSVVCLTARATAMAPLALTPPPPGCPSVQPRVINLPPVPLSGSHCPLTRTAAVSGYHTLRHSIAFVNGTIDCRDNGGVLWSVTNGASVEFNNVDVVASHTVAAYKGFAAGAALVVNTGSLSVSASTFTGLRGAAWGGRSAQAAHGGAILVQNGGVATVTASSFTGCAASELGGAVAVVEGGSASFTDCTFTANSVIDSTVVSAVGGGAIGAHKPAMLSITSCTFERNVAAGHSSAGGAVALRNVESVSVLIHSSTFVDNSAPRGYGGALMSELSLASSVATDGCTFTGSSAAFGGTVAAITPQAVTPVLGVDPAPPSTAAALDGLSPALVLGPGTTVTSSTAWYGGLAFSCGAQIDATGASIAGATVSASSAGGVVFQCVPFDASYPGLVGALPNGTLSSPSAYGASVATPATQMSLRSLPAAAIPGVALGTGLVVELFDELGSAVHDANTRVDVAVSEGWVRVVASAGLTYSAVETAYVGAQVSFEIDVGFWPQNVGSSFTVTLSAPAIGSNPISSSAQFDVELGPCPVGFGAVGTDPSISPLTCVNCAPGTESLVASHGPCTIIPVCAPPALPINGSCQECPANTVRAVVASGIPPCICSAGFWNLRNVPDVPCAQCPHGASCAGGSGPDAAPRALPGFGGVKVGKYAKCPIDDACLGADVCSPEYEQTSLLCKDCATNSYRNRKYGCTSCPASSSSLFALFLVALFGAAIAAVLAGIMAVVQFQNRRDTLGTHHGRVPHTLSLAIIFFQVLGILSRAPFEWPEPPVAQILEAANVFNVDLTIFAVDCTLPSFTARYALSIFIPAAFGVFVFLVLVVIKAARCCTCCCLGKLDRSAMRVRDVLTWAVFTFGPLLFIPLSRSSLAFFDCTQYPDGAWYLDNEPSIECFGSQWTAALPIAIFGVGLYVIALPVLLTVTLRRKRSELGHPQVLLRYGSVYSPYRRFYFWAALPDMGKRLAIVAVSVFASNVHVVLFAGLQSIFLASMVWMQHTEPYLYHPLNVIVVKLDLCIVVVVMCGMLFWTNEFPSTAAFVVCVMAAVAAIAYAVVVLVVGLMKEIAHIRSVARRVGAAETGPRDEHMRNIFRKHAPDLNPRAWPAELGDLVGPAPSTGSIVSLVALSSVSSDGSDSDSDSRGSDTDSKTSSSSVSRQRTQPPIPSGVQKRGGGRRGGGRRSSGVSASPASLDRTTASFVRSRRGE